MVRTTGLLALALVLGAAAPARACVGEGELLAILAGALLVPSEFGGEATTGGGREGAPVIGWAYQVPLDAGSPEPRHRVAMAVEWTPGGRGADVRGRLGYRHVRGPLELGLGVSTGPDRLRLSPELGLRVWQQGDFGVHVRLRGEVPPTAPRDVRGVLTVGWSIAL
jgi:hypothetical protein